MRSTRCPPRPPTPPRHDRGLRRALRRGGVGARRPRQLLHGTTVATNIVLERNGATGMITTRGLPRHHPHRPPRRPKTSRSTGPALARTRSSTAAIVCRSPSACRPRGEVLVPLDEDEVREAVRKLRDATSTRSPSACSSRTSTRGTSGASRRSSRRSSPRRPLDLARGPAAHREYERFSTTALNAYIGPKTSATCTACNEALREGADTDFHLMASNGGTLTVEARAARPVAALMSGPVAGHVGGIAAGALGGHDSVITLDMGGTSADIGVAPGGELRMKHLSTRTSAATRRWCRWSTSTRSAPAAARSPTSTRRRLRVGPQSAGADPGPACYGRGGTEPTATDAQLVLGRLRPGPRLLGGQMQIDASSAERRCASVGDAARVAPTEAALGVHPDPEVRHGQGDQLNSVRRGYDPRDFSLVAVGGGARCTRATSRASWRSRGCSSRPIRASRRRPGCSRLTSTRVRRDRP